MSGFKTPTDCSNWVNSFQILSGIMLGSLILAGCAGEKAPSVDSSSELPTQGTELDPASVARPRKPVAAIAMDFESRHRDQRVSVPSEKDIAGISAESTSRAEVSEDVALANLRGDQANSSESHGLLEIGDKAPEISVVHWLKGNPVKVADSPAVLVLEFFETDYDPCLEVIPRICALQAEYGDRVTFAGISPEAESVVAKFLDEPSGDGGRKWSEILNFPVGIDPQRQAWMAYLDAAEHPGIPCAVVISRLGTVEWIGHPQDLDGPLKEIVDGTWNSAEAKKLAAADRAAGKARRELGPEIRAVVDAQEYSRAVELIDAFLKRFGNDVHLEILRLKCLIHGEMLDEANATAEKLIAAAQDDARQLDKLAWMMATTSESPKINLDLALTAAQRAAELTEQTNCSVIETLARVQFRKGNLAEAIALQKQAINLAPSPEHAEPLRVGLQEFLQQSVSE